MTRINFAIQSKGTNFPIYAIKSERPQFIYAKSEIKALISWKLAETKLHTSVTHHPKSIQRRHDETGLFHIQFYEEYISFDDVR